MYICGLGETHVCIHAVCMSCCPSTLLFLLPLDLLYSSCITCYDYPQIDVLKIDIEGSEFEMFHGIPSKVSTLPGQVWKNVELKIMCGKLVERKGYYLRLVAVLWTCYIRMQATKFICVLFTPDPFVCSWRFPSSCIWPPTTSEAIERPYICPYFSCTWPIWDMRLLFGMITSMVRKSQHISVLDTVDETYIYLSAERSRLWHIAQILVVASLVSCEWGRDKSTTQLT